MDFEVLSHNPQTLYAVHATVGGVVIGLVLVKSNCEAKAFMLKMQLLTYLSCVPVEVVLLRLLCSLLPSSQERQFTSLSYAGMLSIHAKLTAPFVLGCRERVAEFRLRQNVNPHSTHMNPIV